MISGETIFRTIGYPIWSANRVASFSFFARLILVTGMPYSVQMVLASVSKSVFLASFLAWFIIFVVWFKFYSLAGCLCISCFECLIMI